MRQATSAGPCSRCGKTAGLFWWSVPKVLDFGVAGVSPMETDVRTVLLCDDCEVRRRLDDEPGYAELCGLPRRPVE